VAAETFIERARGARATRNWAVMAAARARVETEARAATEEAQVAERTANNISMVQEREKRKG